MLSQMTPKERAIYAVLVAALLFGFGFIGSKQLRVRPELEVEPLAALATAESGVENKEVVVHVVGAVNRPGVVRMSSESRVQDAIRQAGGAKKTANLEEINLAAKLVDGTQLLVPNRGAPAENGEVYRGGGSEAYRAKPKATSAASAGLGQGSISLNAASASQLDRLPGVGPATAAKILEYRQAHGGFSSVEELLAVKGIGPKKLAALRKFVRL